MRNIAKALICSIQYLGNERNDDEYTEDDDLKIVEYVASLIQEASEEEKDLLRQVAIELDFQEFSSQLGID